MNITDVDKFVAQVLLAFWTIDQLPTPNVYTGLCAWLNQTSVLLPVTFLNDQFHAVAFELASVNRTATGVVPPVVLALKLALVLFQTVI